MSFYHSFCNEISDQILSSNVKTLQIPDRDWKINDSRGTAHKQMRQTRIIIINLLCITFILHFPSHVTARKYNVFNLCNQCNQRYSSYLIPYSFSVTHTALRCYLSCLKNKKSHYPYKPKRTNCLFLS